MPVQTLGGQMLMRDKALDGSKVAVARTLNKPLKVAFATLLLKYFPPISPLTTATRFFSSASLIPTMRSP
jgi:hypothetical protein